MRRDFFVIEVDGISIIGQAFLPGGWGEHPVVCLCHGFPSGNPPEAGDGGYPVLAEKICREGFAVVIFNFRGTGDSGGNLDIQGWTRDLSAVVGHICSLDAVDKSHLYLVGFSAGAAASVYVASRDGRVSGVAACACPADFSLLEERGDPRSIVEHYRSIGAIRDDDFPSSARAWREGFGPVAPVDHVGGIAPRPLLLIHGSHDETVPVGHACRMYRAAGEPKQLVILDGAAHRLRQNDRLIVTVLEWLKANCRNSG
jgi:fermentation-respiration switch protein FrsA (DUF1100 family)